MKKTLFILLTAILCSAINAGMFEFYLPWDDDQENFIDLSWMNDKPAGAAGYVHAGQDGHLYAGDKRIRFLGVDITGSACFPEQFQARAIAKRMAKYGINIVRFHLMDMQSQSYIFKPGSTRDLDPDSLDRLDYFFAQLKQNGIYADLNLLCGRDFSTSDGLPADIGNLSWKQKQVPCFFYEPLIDLQKEYAQKLYNRKNPYTGLNYTEDPAVAIVEIINENGLLQGWLTGTLDKVTGEMLENLQKKWNDFLLAKYKTNAALKQAWGIDFTKGGQSLDDKTMHTVMLMYSKSMPEAVTKDWVEFLYVTEDKYWETMRSYIKDTLKMKSLVMGTIVGCSTPNMMAKFDMVDAHAYWKHPTFPHSDWSNSDWAETNATMVTEFGGGTIGDLSMRRVYGKPFCVSEYNHPAPNTYSNEAYIFLSAYAALQDWDAIFGYTYADFSTAYASKKLNGFFDLDTHPGKMMTFIPAAYIFRRGDLAMAKTLATVKLTKQDELDALPSAQTWVLVDARNKDVAEDAALIHRTAIIPDGFSGSVNSIAMESITPPDVYVSDTKEIEWSPGDDGVFKINSAKEKALLGFICNKDFNLSGIKCKVGKTMQNWALVTMSLVEGDNFKKGPGKILVTASGAVANPGMGWHIYPDKPLDFPPPLKANMTIGMQWGTAPSICEGINADIILPYDANKVSVFALDNVGNTKEAVAVTGGKGSAKFSIDEKYQTLWYEAEVK